MCLFKYTTRTATHRRAGAAQSGFDVHQPLQRHQQVRVGSSSSNHSFFLFFFFFFFHVQFIRSPNFEKRLNMYNAEVYTCYMRSSFIGGAKNA